MVDAVVVEVEKVDVPNIGEHGPSSVEGDTSDVV